MKKLAGLRERNKARTRDEIIEAALDLFEARGYDATTVEDIAEAAGVSPRTFFRYFDGKLEVVMAAKFGEHRQHEFDFGELLMARPPDEPPLVALRQVLAVPLEALRDGDVAIRQYRLLMGTPSLRALSLEHFTEHEAELVRGFAARLGVGDDDLRARMLGTAVCATLRTVVEGWLSTGADPDELEVELDRALAMLDEGFGSVAAAPAEPDRRPRSTRHRHRN
jgi:AcrR family transcriptional regulator